MSDVCLKIIQEGEVDDGVGENGGGWWLLSDGYTEVWFIILLCHFCICLKFFIMKSKKQNTKNTKNLIIWCQYLGRKPCRQ